MGSRLEDMRGRPLRLLILTDCPIGASGGSERFLRNLLGMLPAEHYRVTLAQLCEPAATLHQPRLAAVSSAFHLPFTAVYKPDGLRAFLKLKRMVQQEGFDIIQSQHENSDVFGALLPRGPRHAARVSNRRDTGFLKSARLRLLSRFLNRRYDRVVAPATAILDAIERSEAMPRKRMMCIPNGVDTDRFGPVDAATRRTIRASLDCAGTDLLIGCVADLFPVKRHEDLIDAFARVHAELPNARLVLIGNGPLRATMERQIHALGITKAVRMLGSRKDVDVLLPALDVFTLVSDTEGLSNAVLEAQACGLPVIATNVGGNPDLVDAECGELVEVRQPCVLASAMLRLLRDPALRARMGAAARRRVEQNHSLATMARAYEALYRELTDAR